MKYRMLGWMMAAGLCMVLQGCPELTPFSISGNYAGQYTVGQEGGPIDGEAPIQITLQTGHAGLFAANQIQGEVLLDFSTNAIAQSLVALGMLDQGVLVLPPITVNGVLAPDGTLLLNSAGVLDECAQEYCIRLGFAGAGTDADADGKMDHLEGTWAGALQKNEMILPLTGDFHVVIAE